MEVLYMLNLHADKLSTPGSWSSGFPNAIEWKSNMHMGPIKELSTWWRYSWYLGTNTGFKGLIAAANYPFP